MSMHSSEISALANAVVRRAHLEISGYNAGHPPRYLVVVKPVIGRTIRYYDHHEWQWQKGAYAQVPQFKKRCDASLLMRDLNWAERIAKEIGGKVIDTLAERPGDEREDRR